MSKIEVNNIEQQCGSTLTLGASGTTVTLACGASQTGFGRSGAVNWCTTAKTSPFTSATTKGYFVNTTSGVITVTLPASPSAGQIVAFKDYGGTWGCNAVTLCRNSSKINGQCFNVSLSTNAQSITLIYVDATKGWQDIQDSTSDVTGAPNYVTATGGNTTITCGDFKTHIFTGAGTLCVSAGGTASGSNTVDYFVVAGGGSGGVGRGAGGGAGGFRLFSSAPGSNSPLNAPSGLSVSAQSYPVSVGAGGVARSFPDPAGSNGAAGSNSIFSTITSAGGAGGGGGNHPGPSTGAGPSGQISGGSGGGGGYYSSNPAASINTGGSGNTPPVSPSQGNNGGDGSPDSGSSGPTPQRGGGGGGGAGAVGTSDAGGPGGAGSYVADSFFGPTAPSYGTPGPVSSTRYFAGGGGGGKEIAGSPTGGDGGGAGGSGGSPGAVSCGGTTNTGGGGGGTGEGGGGSSAGGSGFVAIRYKFQN